MTTTPDNFTQTEDRFLDGRLHKTSGDLAPAMEYAYTATATGPHTSQAYLDGATHREASGDQFDWAGRTTATGPLPDLSSVTTDHLALTTSHEYNTLGQLAKTADADGVTTLYACNSRGERVLTAVDLNANGAIDHGTDTVKTFPTPNSSAK